MELNIQSLHFTASGQLQSFIEKKCQKLEKFCDTVVKADVILEVVKPDTSLNKQARISVAMQGAEAFAEKTCDTFEQAVDECVEALQKQLIKNKEKQREK